MSSLLQESNGNNAGNQDEIMDDSSSIVAHLGFVLDIKNNKNKWVREQMADLIQYTIQMINEGFFDGVVNFPDNTVMIEGLVQDADCDTTSSAKAYANLRRMLNDTPPIAVIGARCSASSSSLAMVSGTMDNVPQISHASSSPTLSNSSDYPLFSRLVAPDNAMGQVGALVSMLKSLGWSRVSIIKTDNQYSRDLALSFQRLWIEHQGEIPYENEVQVNSDDDKINEESLNEVLRSFPRPDSMMTKPGSRVILLIAHEQHAYDILRHAHGIGFQKDTFWVGTMAWTGRSPEDFAEPSFLEGYIGVTPYRNRDKVYQDYLHRLNALLSAAGKPTFEELPDYTAETMVDSILAYSMALSKLPVSSRHNGTLVTEIIRNLSFQGVSGKVEFTADGDRANPAYRIVNAKKNATTGKLDWVDVGKVLVNSTNGNTTNEIRLSDMCFAQIGCRVTTAPDDSYRVLLVPLWVVIVNPLIVVALGAVLYRYCRSRRKKNRLKQDIKKFLKLMNESAEELRHKLVRERYEKPPHWTDSESILVDVTPVEDEYWSLLAELRRDMPDAHISRLWRVQNHSLWAYYSFHKDRLFMNDIDYDETRVWHGTKKVDPGIIYNDRQDGFMMQFARRGLWGRGIYFATRSSYSHRYAYKPYGEDWQGTFNDRPIGRDDEREMFFANLLVGRATHLERPCYGLIVPPEDPDRPGQRFNTVKGETCGSTVFTVYENGRAYPDYVVRYYRGERRDPTRTPFATQDEAKQNKGSRTQYHPSSSEENNLRDSGIEMATATSSSSSTDDLESGPSDNSCCGESVASQDSEPDFIMTGSSHLNQHNDEVSSYIASPVSGLASLSNEQIPPRTTSESNYDLNEESAGEEEQERELQGGLPMQMWLLLPDQERRALAQRYDFSTTEELEDLINELE